MLTKEQVITALAYMDGCGGDCGRVTRELMVIAPRYAMTATALALYERCEKQEAENRRLLGLINELAEWGERALRKETAEQLWADLAPELAFFSALAGKGE